MNCPAGRFSAAADLNACEAWTTTCARAGDGLQGDGTSLSDQTCGDCAVGQYAGTSDNSCSSCAAGQFAAARGSAACTACAVGLSSDAGASVCVRGSRSVFQGELVCRDCQDSAVIYPSLHDPATGLMACCGFE